MKTGNASSKRFDRIESLKNLSKFNCAGSSPDGDNYYEEEDVCNAVVEFRCKLKEYGNDYLTSYYDKVFGRFD